MKLSFDNRRPDPNRERLNAHGGSVCEPQRRTLKVETANLKNKNEVDKRPESETGYRRANLQVGERVGGCERTGPGMVSRV